MMSSIVQVSVHSWTAEDTLSCLLVAVEQRHVPRIWIRRAGREAPMDHWRRRHLVGELNPISRGRVIVFETSEDGELPRSGRRSGEAAELCLVVPARHPPPAVKAFGVDHDSI
jgi:hypothetical protein